MNNGNYKRHFVRKLTDLYRTLRLWIDARNAAQEQDLLAYLFDGRQLNPALYVEYARLKASRDIMRFGGSDAVVQGQLHQQFKEL